MNKISKKVAFITCMALIIGSSFSTFATNVDANSSNVTNGTKKVRVNTEKKVDTKTIIGKISNISADNVTIQELPFCINCRKWKIKRCGQKTNIKTIGVRYFSI